MNWRKIIGASVVFSVCAGGAWAAESGDDVLPEVIGFNHHVRPILSDKCYACHGPDANTRKADLRLDRAPEGTPPEGHRVAIVPGDPDASALVQRIRTADADDQMPPPDQKKQLTEGEKAILQAWIKQGAEYEPHWAYIPPAPHDAIVAIPIETHPIDTFVTDVLAREGLGAQPEADRPTLIRRLSWDLLGVPPTPEAVDAFVADTSPDAYEKLVNELLASPHFGERMAMGWLDAVRYADSNGYHSDEFRNISAYRDYVIHAFNSNMPFDQFTREQIAGDLLPNPTREQLIASGYNRLNQITAEGGAQAKEYIAKYAADRVRTTATVWMGATMGCAECHDHKFDPISARDFYAFSAFFADIEEKGVYGSGQKWDPFMYLPTPEEEAKEAELTAKIQSLESMLSSPSPALEAAQQTWETQVLAQRDAQDSAWTLATPNTTETQGETILTVLDDGRLLAQGAEQDKDVYTLHIPTEDASLSALLLETFNHPDLNGVSRGGGNFVLTKFNVTYRAPGAESTEPVRIVAALADYEQAKFPVSDALSDDGNKGWAVDGHTKKEDHRAIFRFGDVLKTAVGGQLDIELRFESNHAGHQIDCFRLKYTGDEGATTPWIMLPQPVQAALDVLPEERSDADKTTLAAYYREITPALQSTRDELIAARSERDGLKAGMATTLIAKSLPEPRVTRVLPRGNWLDESGEVVLPDTPAALPALGVTDRRATRLDLANWLVREDNPLMARVTVNRLWKGFYGRGISKVLDDLGAQGEWPTHPKLLDWLASEFVASGWDVKHMVRVMVTSGAYRKSSQPTPELRAKDPYNRYYARQSRVRIEAELVRDGALAMSGLLAPDLGGRSVFPYQPEGYYANCNTFGGVLAYDTDTGANQYRRGLYTFWKRSFLHPSLLAFDAPSREECTAERTVSNTPLQALVLLNDPTFVEAARVFAQRIMTEGGERSDDRIVLAYRYALSREPDVEELNLIRNLYHEHLIQYTEDPEAAQAILEAGQAPVPEGINAVDLAAWTSVTRVILNLHETITRS